MKSGYCVRDCGTGGFVMSVHSMNCHVALVTRLREARDHAETSSKKAKEDAENVEALEKEYLQRSGKITG